MKNDKSSPIDSWMEEFSHLLRSSRQALQPGKIALATVGLMVTFMLGHTLDWIWVGCGSGMSRAMISTCPMIVENPGEDELARGIFAVLIEHEKYCLDQTLRAARTFSLTDGMGSIWRLLDDHDPKSRRPRPEAGHGYGLLAFVFAGLYGAYWSLTEHWLFSVIFGLLSVVVWALAGGGICRISALQFAKKQQLSARAAVAFSASRLGHFLVAPLLPLVMILLFTVLLLVGGWITHVPLAGGVLFGLTLLGGAVVAMMLMFVVGGSSLMWPAIAVENAECTDAIGRSSSYFFERMERAVIYALFAMIYGALVWMVVRLFAFLLAYCVHGLVGTTFSDLGQMWETPAYDRLYSAPAKADQIEGWSDRLTFQLIKTWVSLGGFLLYGFLVSYYFTCSTIIYYLLRGRVDENELDDVYTEALEPSSPLPSPPST